MSDDPMDHSGSNHRFVVYWCSEGLEYVGDVTEDGHAAVMARLRDEKYHSRIPNVMHLELRARFNSQRHYECWVVDAVEGITAEDIREMFEADPQTAADLIRSRGTRVFGEPMGKQRVVIR
jgi:hypothetical protein